MKVTPVFLITLTKITMEVRHKEILMKNRGNANRLITLFILRLPIAWLLVPLINIHSNKKAVLRMTGIDLKIIYKLKSQSAVCKI